MWLPQVRGGLSPCPQAQCSWNQVPGPAVRPVKWRGPDEGHGVSLRLQVIEWVVECTPT